jgi:hypothetical protein
VPLPISPAHFHELAALGQTLVALHTLDSANAPVLLEARFPFRKESGDNVVGKSNGTPATEFLAFNDSRGWDSVPPKFGIFKSAAIKSRANGSTTGVVERFLMLKSHTWRVLVALDETRRLMEEIDEIGVVAPL